MCLFCAYRITHNAYNNKAAHKTRYAHTFVRIFAGARSTASCAAQWCHAPLTVKPSYRTSAALAHYTPLSLYRFLITPTQFWCCLPAGSSRTAFSIVHYVVVATLTDDLLTWATTPPAFTHGYRMVVAGIDRLGVVTAAATVCFMVWLTLIVVDVHSWLTRFSPLWLWDGRASPYGA
jgi:hypothetical protein